MPIDATLHLDTVRCIAESDGSGASEPYLWPVLLYSDDTTIADQSFVRAVAPASDYFREVVVSGMRAGDTGGIPAGQRLMRVRFEDGTNPKLTLIVAMFEWDETPDDAARAAYVRFTTAIVEELRAFILTNLRAPDPSVPEEIDPIIAAVDAKVTSAGRSELSWWEKARVAAGTLNLDDQVDVQIVADIQPSSFTLMLADGDSSYEVDGRFELQPVAVDLCTTQAAGVQQAQAALDNIEATISALQSELHGGASGSEKAAIIAEIRRIRAEEVPAAVAALDAARAALAQCRAGTGGGGWTWHPHVLDGTVLSGVFTDVR